MGNNTIMIVDYDWENSNGEIFIPVILDGYPVTIIGEQAFAVDEKETPPESVIVHLAEGIKEIREKAFFNSRISGINIPNSVTKIGAGAFARCSIQQFYLDGSHEVFAVIDGALYNKTTKTLIAYSIIPGGVKAIPNGIKEIGDYAFAYLRRCTETDPGT